MGKDVSFIFDKILDILQTWNFKEITIETCHETCHETKLWNLEIIVLVLRKSGSIVNLQIWWKLSRFMERRVTFCPKCKCRAAGKEGIFQLSHCARDHADGYGQQNSNTQQLNIKSSSNTPVIDNYAPSTILSRYVINPSVGVPTGPPELWITETSSQCE